MAAKDETITPHATSVARDLKVLVSRLRRRIREAGDAGGLTAPQASVLARLTRMEKASTSELAGAERVRPQSMATILKALEAQGLIERAADPDDGRRQIIALSSAGRERAAGGRAAREEWLAAELAGHYDEAELARIAEALELLDRVVSS